MVSVPGLDKPFEPGLFVTFFFLTYRPHRDFKASTKCHRMSSVFPTRSECMYSSRPVPVLLCFAPGQIIYELI